MIPLKIDLLLNRIRQEYQRPPPKWVLSHSIPSAHQRWIHQEAQTPSEFDALQLRKNVLQYPSQSIVYATCPYGFLIVYFEQYDPADLPWDMWGRILRLFYEGQRFTVYLLASSTPRRFPSPPGSRSPGVIKPEHINGGYTYPCRTDTIVIYRAEDATRVLLHELQHASCLDHPERGIDWVEAETEAWAELLYIALLAKGDPREWQRSWVRQWSWIQQQNKQVRRHLRGGLNSVEFPWRYTLGKEEVLRDWFPSSALPSPTSPPMNSLRLTTPPTATQKREQGVRPSSPFL
jgi:hypothetical protein